MGDGGVACLPLQDTMVRFSITETFCGGNDGNGFSSKSLKFADSERRMNMKPKSEEFVRKGEVDKGELERGKSSREVEHGEICGEKAGKEEVEEGELGTLKWGKSDFENGEFSREKPLRSEIEKGEFVPDKWRKGEEENGEFVPDKWEPIQERGRKWEHEKGEFRSWKGSKDEVEKGEIVPERWSNRDEYSYAKSRRYDSGKDKSWKYEPERTPPPPGKYFGDDVSQRKEFIRSGSQHTKRPSRWVTGLERDSRISPKVPFEENSYKNEPSNGKNHGREYMSANRLKRHGTDSDSSELKHNGEFGDYTGLKTRRPFDDSSRAVHPEHYSRLSMERSYRNSSLARMSSSDRYSSRQYDSSLSSKVVYDRYGRSPGQSGRSPRARYHDHRDLSPVRRDRSPFDRRERSPYDRRERSPYDWRERSPYERRERSPYERSRQFDHKTRSPTNADQSPQDRARRFDHRDRTPNFLEKSPLARSRPNGYRQIDRKIGPCEKRYGQYGNKGQEEKLNQRDSSGRDSLLSSKESDDRSSLHNDGGSVERNTAHQPHKEDGSQTEIVNCKETLQVNGTVEEPVSMEEDMDICDTPPHSLSVADSTTGKWYYLDHFGTEQGPSKLCDLKALVEEGVIVSDHLIKHLDSDRWVTVENAASPLVTPSFPPIVSDTVTQLVSPPEAPGNLLVDGNLLADNGEAGQSGYQLDEDAPVTLSHPIICPDESKALSEPVGDLHIDERVGALLDGFPLIPGREIETIGEVLQMTFENAQWERWGDSEDFSLHRPGSGEHYDQRTDELSRNSEVISKEAIESRLSDNDYAFPCGDSVDWCSGRWSCKGGDWKWNDDAAHDRSSKSKLVFNDGFPLCQMPKSGYEDPRWHRKDELYYPSHSRRLDLPPWAFSCQDEKNDCNPVSRSNQLKLAAPKPVKGTLLPVVRINVCVVKDHGSFVSEPRPRIKGREKYSSRSARPYSAASDLQRSSTEGASSSKIVDEQDSQGSSRCIVPINTSKDHLCTADELQLHLGDWYYLDGAGHERGPSSFSELQVLVDQGVIQNYSSVFRKVDKVWVPVTSVGGASEGSVKTQLENTSMYCDTSRQPLQQLPNCDFSGNNLVSSPFHSLYPQFIGYTRGKLHELVMKSYRSREFAAAINEVLDPWIGTKQPKKEMEKYFFNITNKSSLHEMNKYRKSEGDASLMDKDQIRAGKRARVQLDSEDYEMEEAVLTVQKDEYNFEDLCCDIIFNNEDTAHSEAVMGNWGLLDGHTLARVFHFLKSDVRSLTYAALACKHWRAAVKFYKDISRQIDFSSVGPICTDSVVWNVMNGYNKEKITSLVLIGCTNITASVVEEILLSFPSLSFVDVRGCSQFGELTYKFPNVNWIKSRSPRGTNIIDEAEYKLRISKQTMEKTSTVSKTFKGLNSHTDDFDELKYYFETVDKREAASQSSFRRSLYKRSKLYDARKSSSIFSRDARLRRWTIKKSENGYKRTEEFLAFSLNDIMKENTFDFFVPKVAEIEDRMRSEYYIGHGLSTVKEDISRMCRDAMKFILLGNGLRSKMGFDLCRKIVKNPEFYNIYLERPKGDDDGYDLVVVDAMHKANYASRICHSCRPNCEAK